MFSRVFFSVCFAAYVLAAGVLAGHEARIYVPFFPHGDEWRAAAELSEYWEKMTGSPAEIRREGTVEPFSVRWSGRGRSGAFAGRRSGDVSRPAFVVYVGETAMGEGIDITEFDGDAFVLRAVEGGLVLRGNRPRETRFAVSYFLREYGGVRWYFPGPLGEHVPEWEKERMPDIDDVVEPPGFRSRALSNPVRFDGGAWAQRHFLRRRYHFHHNVRRIFLPEMFDEHPEVFPEYGGERYRPQPDGSYWQPCFGNPKTAEIAAEAARVFFDNHPDAVSFSVGMNDGKHICECDLCRGLVDHGRTFRDKPDYSDLVFTFTNRVAEHLEETHPDRYVGALAYHWAENTPSFEVHPRVIPYLTADRSQWIDERFRNEDRDLMKRWTEAGPEKIGIYDYYYGFNYVIPRIYTGITDESLKYARGLGIDGVYAEVYSRWSLDGPKTWLLARLMWDPESDAGKLLDEYYENLFGPAAGPMRRYFELAEERWNAQEGRPFWLRYYRRIEQLELFPPEVCAEARKHLDEAAILAGGEFPYRERVRLFSRGFRLTELYSNYYHFVHDLPGEDALGEETGRALLERILRFGEDYEALLLWKRAVIERDPLHRETNNAFLDHLGFRPEMRLGSAVSGLKAWGGENDAGALVTLVLDRAQESFPAARLDTVREIGRRQAASRTAGRELLQNGNFGADVFRVEEEEYLGVRGRVPFGWRLDRRDGTGSGFYLSDATTYRGSLALRAEDAIEERAYVIRPVDPEALYRFAARAKGRVGAGGRVRIEMVWRDAAGRLVEGDWAFADQLPEGRTEDWTLLQVSARPPDGAAWLEAALVVESQDGGDFATFDAASLEAFEP